MLPQLPKVDTGIDDQAEDDHRVDDVGEEGLGSLFGSAVDVGVEEKGDEAEGLTDELGCARDHPCVPVAQGEAGRNHFVEDLTGAGVGDHRGEVEEDRSGVVLVLVLGVVEVVVDFDDTGAEEEDEADEEDGGQLPPESN